MSLSTLFRTDSKKETEGARMEFPANEDGSIPVFIVSRTHGRANQRYAKAFEKNTAPVRAEMRLKTLDNARANRLVLNAFIEGALNGWENIVKSDVTGNPDDTGFADYTEDNARSLFSRLPELFSQLQEFANDVANYREESAAADAKN